VEALDMPILHRPAGLDVNQPELPVLGPAHHRREVNSGPLSERRIWCPYLVSMSEFRHLTKWCGARSDFDKFFEVMKMDIVPFWRNRGRRIAL